MAPSQWSKTPKTDEQWLKARADEQWLNNLMAPGTCLINIVQQKWLILATVVPPLRSPPPKAEIQHNGQKVLLNRTKTIMLELVY